MEERLPMTDHTSTPGLLALNEHEASFVIGLLSSVIRKLVDDENIVLNDGGYLVDDVMDGYGYGTGTRCIDLTPDEFMAVRAVLSSDEPEGAG